MSNILAVITKAIEEQRRVALREKDHTTIRVLEPYVVYVNRDGNILVDGFRRDPRADDEAVQKLWITLPLSNIHAAYMLNDQFIVHVPKDFDPAADAYRAGLMAMIDTGDPQNTMSQVRKIWTNLGSALDQMLSDNPKRNK